MLPKCGPLRDPELNCPFQGYDRAFLPVHWYSNKKGWMTGALFSEYYKNKLHSELKAYCNKEGIPFNILLLVDNAPSHPPSLENLSTNIKLAFLPPNTTSLLQPCDQGIIQTFKSYYLRSTMAAAVKKMNEEDTTLTAFWKGFTIKDALVYIQQSWEQVSRKCLNGVWKKLCPQFVHAFEGFTVDDDVSKANKDTVTFAKDLGLAEVEEEDIEELLLSHRQELTNEDLLEIEAENKREQEEAAAAAAAAAVAAADKDEGLAMTAKRLNEALAKVREGLAMLEEMDPNVERSSTATRKAMDALFCYTLMHKEFSKKKRQTTMLKFFKKTPVEDVVPEKDVDDPVEAEETQVDDDVLDSEVDDPVVAEEAQVDDDVLDSEVESDDECL